VISVIKLQANGDDIELLQVHRHNTKIDGTKIDEMSLIASRPALRLWNRTEHQNVQQTSMSCWGSGEWEHLDL